MNVWAAEGELRARLAQRGIGLTDVHNEAVGRGADAGLAWEAFRAVAGLPIDQAVEFDDGNVGTVGTVDATPGGDLLQFASAVTEQRSPQGWRSLGAPPEPTVFTLGFTRQFAFVDSDCTALGLEALVLTIEFPLTRELHDSPPVVLWGHGGPGAQEWIGEVERSAPFVAAFAGRAARLFFFSQGAGY